MLPGTDPIAAAKQVPAWVIALPIVVALVGILAAYYAYMMKPNLPGKLRTDLGTYKFLLNKWYFDELYDFLFVRPAHRLGRNLWKDGDGAVIDGLTRRRRGSCGRFTEGSITNLVSLPLCLRDADWCSWYRHMVSRCGARA